MNLATQNVSWYRRIPIAGGYTRLPSEWETEQETAARLSRQLKPIAWGTPDPKLALGVCRSIERATPVITIPYIRRVDRKLREYLRTHGIHCH